MTIFFNTVVLRSKMKLTGGDKPRPYEIPTYKGLNAELRSS
jgi:hypothetical protein